MSDSKMVSVDRDTLESLLDSARQEADERVRSLGEDYRPHVLASMRKVIAEAETALAVTAEDGPLTNEGTITQAIDMVADVRAADGPVAIVCGSQVQWLPSSGKIPDRSPLFIHAKRETVIPERMNLSNDSEILGSIGLYGHVSVFAAATLWNHCIDEFKRLNP